MGVWYNEHDITSRVSSQKYYVKLNTETKQLIRDSRGRVSQELIRRQVSDRRWQSLITSLLAAATEQRELRHLCLPSDPVLLFTLR